MTGACAPLSVRRRKILFVVPGSIHAEWPATTEGCEGRPEHSRGHRARTQATLTPNLPPPPRGENKVMRDPPPPHPKRTQATPIPTHTHTLPPSTKNDRGGAMSQKNLGRSQARPLQGHLKKSSDPAEAPTPPSPPPKNSSPPGSKMEKGGSERENEVSAIEEEQQVCEVRVSTS